MKSLFFVCRPPCAQRWCKPSGNWPHEQRLCVSHGICGGKGQSYGIWGIQVFFWTTRNLTFFQQRYKCWADRVSDEETLLRAGADSWRWEAESWYQAAVHTVGSEGAIVTDTSTGQSSCWLFQVNIRSVLKCSGLFPPIIPVDLNMNPLLFLLKVEHTAVSKLLSF